MSSIDDGSTAWNPISGSCTIEYVLTDAAFQLVGSKHLLTKVSQKWYNYAVNRYRPLKSHSFLRTSVNSLLLAQAGTPLILYMKDKSQIKGRISIDYRT